MKSSNKIFLDYKKSDTFTEKSISMNFEAELINSLSASTPFAKDWISLEQEEGSLYLIELMKKKVSLEN